MVFSINLSGKVFIFKDFNADHKDWLNFSDELIGLVKFIVTFTNLKATYSDAHFSYVDLRLGFT